MERRAAEMKSLTERISKLKGRFYELQENELKALRPIMDQYYTMICEIQQKMACLWTEYTTRMTAAQNDMEIEIVALQGRISFLDQENTKSQSFLAPIRRLPTELLAEIFVIAIEGYGQDRFDMMCVCRAWRATIISMARLWSRVTIRPSTSREQVEFVVERTKQVPLDVTIDSESIYRPCKVSGEGGGAYAGLAVVMSTMSRWRSLTIAFFPSEGDIVAASGGENAIQMSAGPFEKLEIFKISSLLESGTSFNQLLDHVATTSTPRLKCVELASQNAIWFLADPKYRGFFGRLTHFKVDVREMRDPANILPYFENLEVLEAYRLHLPIYPHDLDLPIVRTIRRMSIKIVSVQWMSGRTFPALEDCTIIWPHHPETLRLHGGVNLPVCTQFTYDDHLIEPMSEFRLPKLDKMVVRNEAWNKPRGSLQLASVWGESANPTWLRPRALHLDTQCHDQHLINALLLLPDLEELLLGLVRPDGLGKKFFNTMVARRSKGASSPSAPISNNLLIAPLVPKLKAFGVRYRRWIREKEKDEITPLLDKIIQSREKTEVPLRSVRFWPTRDTPDEDAKELVQLRV